MSCFCFPPEKSYFVFLVSPSKSYYISIEASSPHACRFTADDSCLQTKISHHPLTYCNFFIFPTSCQWKLRFYGSLEKDFLVKFSKIILLRLVYLSHLRWVNKLHLNASRSSYSIVVWFRVVLFAFLAAISSFVSPDKVSYCDEFSVRRSPSFIFSVKLISLQTLLYCFISYKHWKWFQVTKLSLQQRIRRIRKKTFSFYIFHCFRIIVVIVAGAIQLMRFYWKNNSFSFCFCSFSQFSRAFITHLNISYSQVSLRDVKTGNKLMDFQFNFAFFSTFPRFPFLK